MWNAVEVALMAALLCSALFHLGWLVPVSKPLAVFLEWLGPVSLLLTVMWLVASFDHDNAPKPPVNGPGGEAPKTHPE